MKSQPATKTQVICSSVLAKVSVYSATEQQLRRFLELGVLISFIYFFFLHSSYIITFFPVSMQCNCETDFWNFAKNTFHFIPDFTWEHLNLFLGWRWNSNVEVQQQCIYNKSKTVKEQ